MNDVDLPPILTGKFHNSPSVFTPESREAIEATRQQGLLAVEMEAAALYAFATARRRAVICFA